jgi:hypothetical protein
MTPSTLLATEINSLGVRKDENKNYFQLRDEGEEGDFLGTRISEQVDGVFLLTQTVLIEKVRKAGGMDTAHLVRRPASTTALGSDKDGDCFNEDW